MRATNLATREESTFEILPECPAGDITWTVAPDDPMGAGGALVSDVVDEPGEYAFVAELIDEFDPAVFEGTVQ